VPGTGVLLNAQGCGSWRVKRKYRNSLDPFDVAGLPTLVEGGFGRAVEPDDDEIPLARHSREPVAGLARGCLGPR